MSMRDKMEGAIIAATELPAMRDERTMLVAHILNLWRVETKRKVVAARPIAGARYVIGAGPNNEAICLHTAGTGYRRGCIDGKVLRAMFAEANALGLSRPLHVYGTTCLIGAIWQRGQRPSWYFHQRSVDWMAPEPAPPDRLNFSGG